MSKDTNLSYLSYQLRKNKTKQKKLKKKMYYREILINNL